MSDDAQTARRGRGRAPGFVMSQYHRDKIANANVLNALIEHVEGRREMTATQVTAGLGLLRKVLPDLAQVESTVTVRRDPADMTDGELADIAAGRGNGAAAPTSGEEEPASFH